MRTFIHTREWGYELEKSRTITKKLMGFNMILEPFVPYAHTDVDRLYGLYMVTYRKRCCVLCTSEIQAKDLAEYWNKTRKGRRKLFEFKVEKSPLVLNYTKTMYVL